LGQALVARRYAGLGAAGLAASIATGGVAPAVGFGLVASCNRGKSGAFAKPRLKTGEG